MKLNEFIIVEYENNEHYETNVFIGSSATDEICDYILDKISEVKGEYGTDALIGGYSVPIDTVISKKEIRDMVIFESEIHYGPISINVCVYSNRSDNYYENGYIYQVNKNLSEE